MCAPVSAPQRHTRPFPYGCATASITTSPEKEARNDDNDVVPDVYQQVPW
ncbi:hypothetical protein [Nocardia carnea]|nr:hypothetical protein [Nocardia carnea]